MDKGVFELALIGIAARVASWFPAKAIVTTDHTGKKDSFAAFSGSIAIDGVRRIDVWANADASEASFGHANSSDSATLGELETQLRERLA